MTSVKDHNQRIAALDPAKSFIIQAPAGSGKTELLTQRFLALLANTKQDPEEVVAITFTRKAASEMRARIYESLLAAQHPAPSSDHGLLTWQLANKVLARDAKSKWNLLQNPNRLRIFTIDALCAKIAKSAPLLSQFGTIPQVMDDSQQLYIEAARLLLRSLQEIGPWNDALEKLLLHLDNNYLLAENLFVGMLSRRDQWLSYIINHKDIEDSRALLEKGLQNIICETLTQAATSFSFIQKNELFILANFAGEILNQAQSGSMIAQLKQMTDFPSDQLHHLNDWKGLQELLLTQKGDWRRKVDKRCGFPTPADASTPENKIRYKQNKERMNTFLEHLSTQDDILSCMQKISVLPPSQYSDQQWEIIESLTQLLPILVAFLHTIFRERNVVDFIAIAQGAIYALGDEDNPSDLALNLDYRIQHLLVDEFQDTSATQYRLLELLTSGWEAQDGRTLFLVGDPMQSIYRFREAEVGIFLKVKQQGIGLVKLQPLTLEVNFRSHAGIIEWLNCTFQSIFPKQENIELGAISFSPSTAFSEINNHNHVVVHPLQNVDDRQEASEIIQIIQKEQSENPDHSIAVLVRSRTHLQEIIPAMKKANLNFQAIEIERLIYSIAVSDLFALTKALSHLADRISWLAILRAPWCGLTLTDLFHVANYSSTNTIWESLRNYTSITALSTDGANRLARIVPILVRAIQNKFREDFRQWLSNVWQNLGAPACLDEEFEIQNANAYFNLIDELQTQGELDLVLLEQKLHKAYSHSGASDAKIHVLTIHKAKGLEYDVVIIPSLEKKPAIDSNQLLAWLERTNVSGGNDLIFAPIKSLEEDSDPIYRYIRTQENIKGKHEIVRLLYVAITRARTKLHLLGTVNFNEQKDQLNLPASGSFLGILWPCLQQHFENVVTLPIIQDKQDQVRNRFLTRLTSQWQNYNFLEHKKINSRVAKNNFAWSAQHLRHVGIVIHEHLQRLSQLDPAHWQLDEKLQLNLWQKSLNKHSVPPSHLAICLEMIGKAISNVIPDTRAQWLLNKNHLAAQSEYAVSVNLENEIHHLIIDRTFIDEHDNRWIIDYKTTDILDEQPEHFLAKAKIRYLKQLENYGTYFKLTENRPIKLGLYFPLFGGWTSWNYLEN